MDPETSWRDPSHWRAGIYSCPEDPRLVVPKQRPWMGWTINFAHGRRSWAALLGLVAFATVPVLLSMLMALRTLPARGGLPLERALKVFAPPALVMGLSLAAVCVLCARLSRTR